jgi:hypothetical protein
MKKVLTPNLVFLVVFTLMMILMFSCKLPKEDYKYRVYYRTNENHSDYTNSIEYLPNGGIRYTDECNRQVERFGTFSIVKLK